MVEYMKKSRAKKIKAPEIEQLYRGVYYSADLVDGLLEVWPQVSVTENIVHYRTDALGMLEDLQKILASDASRRLRQTQ